jgi:O-antigen/teichoic acid export membrane protein
LENHTQKPEDTLKKRYIFKLSANLITLGLNVVIQAIVPRGLGPKSYGDFSFITNFFQQIVSFLDLWTTPCFFIKFSQRQKESGLVLFTFLYVGISSIILILILLFIGPGSNILSVLLPGQVYLTIVLGAILILVTWISQILNNMTDAYGLTVKSEIGRVFQKIIGFLLVLVIFIFHKLNIVNYIYTQYISILILILAFVWIISRNRSKEIFSSKISFLQIKAYFKEYYNYSYPLFFIGFISLLTGILDRWLLQKFGGSIEQGFFGISNQVGMVCFLFTSAMIPLIMREFSVSSIQNDINKISLLYRQYVPMLFSIVTIISCFLIFQADKVVLILGGNEFKNATLAVGIMCFFPIHQTYGQLNGSVFMATGQTGLYSKIGVTFMVLGIPVSYFLLAGRSNLGLNFGATGLAVKMVLIQLIVVNIQLYFISKYLKINFWKYTVHQVVSIACFSLLSIFALYFETNFLSISDSILLNFILSGLIYIALVITLIYFKPVLLGLSRETMNNFLRSITKNKFGD